MDRAILSPLMIFAAVARHRIGIAMVLEGRANAPLASGRLVRVLEDWCPSFPGFHICYTTRRQMRPVMRALVDHFRWRV